MEDNVHPEPGLFVRRPIPIEQGLKQRQGDAEQGSAVRAAGQFHYYEDFSGRCHAAKPDIKPIFIFPYKPVFLRVQPSKRS